MIKYSRPHVVFFIICFFCQTNVLLSEQNIAALLGEECPICQDDWYPLPFETNGTSLRNNVSISPALLYWKQDDRSTLPIGDAINVITSCENSIAISVDFYSDTLSMQEFFVALAKIDPARIRYLRLIVPAYSLSDENIQQILEMSQLEYLALCVEKTPVCLLEHLNQLSTLKHFAYVGHHDALESEIILGELNKMPSLKFVGLESMFFQTDLDWKFPEYLASLEIIDSNLTNPFFETIGKIVSLKHFTLLEVSIEQDLYHKINLLLPPNIKCFETTDQKISNYVLQNLDKYPELRFLDIDLSFEDAKKINDHISKVRNRIRVLVLPDFDMEEQNALVANIRKINSIYVDISSDWFRKQSAFRESRISQAKIANLILDVKTLVEKHPQEILGIQSKPVFAPVYRPPQSDCAPHTIAPTTHTLGPTDELPPSTFIPVQRLPDTTKPQETPATPPPPAP